jgi:phosphate transport system substrate-binding protein
MSSSVKRQILAVLALTTIACGGGDAGQSDSTRGSGSVDLTGAGATFPYPLYAKWISEYQARTGVRINYQSIGSGGGVRQISEQTIDFGASDAPMSDSELAAAKGGPILHVPTAIGVLAIAYNVPEISAPLRLSGEVIADIYLGTVTRWNDPRIAALNPGVTLPARDILAVRRSEGSGTTFVFTEYLSAVSPRWATGPGKGKEVAWPVGLGARGNEGVAAQVKQTPYAVGYIELAYAKQNDLPAALVSNAAGEFVSPTPEAGALAGAGVLAQLGPDTDYRVSIVNSPAAGAYPIASLTWILMYRQQPDAAKARKLADFLRWAVTDGEAFAGPLHYAPLPAQLSQGIVARLDSIVPR